MVSSPAGAWQVLHQLVEQVADAGAVLGGHLEKRVEAELVELHRRVARAAHVGLVHHREDRDVGATDLADDLGIAGHEPLLTVEHEHQDVGLREGALAALEDQLVERIVARAEHAPRVEQREVEIVPGDGLFDHVAGRAGHGRDNGAARPRDPVEERGLADIRPSDEHDEGQSARPRSAPPARVAGRLGSRSTSYGRNPGQP